MTEHALDAVALAVEFLVVADCFLAVRFGRNDGRDTALLEIGVDGIAVVNLIGKQRLGALLRQID